MFIVKVLRLSAVWGRARISPCCEYWTYSIVQELHLQKSSNKITKNPSKKGVYFEIMNQQAQQKEVRPNLKFLAYLMWNKDRVFPLHLVSSIILQTESHTFVWPKTLHLLFTLRSALSYHHMELGTPQTEQKQSLANGQSKLCWESSGATLKWLVKKRSDLQWSFCVKQYIFYFTLQRTEP